MKYVFIVTLIIFFPVITHSQSYRQPRTSKSFYDEGLKYLGMAKALYNRQDYERASYDFMFAITGFDNSSIQDSNYYQAKLYQGLTLMQRPYPDYNQVIQNFNFVLNKNPTLVVALTSRGKAKSKLNDFKGAIEDFSKVIEINPNDPSTYCLRAEIKDCISEDYSGTLADCKKALEINPKIPMAFFLIADVNNKQKDIAGALVNYSKAIEIEPNFFYAFFKRGEIKINQNDFNGAIEDFNKAIEINPQFDLAISARGFAKKNHSDYIGAIADFNKILDTNHQYSSEIFIARARTKILLKDLRGAILDFNLAIEIKPQNGDAYLGRGIVFIELGQKENGCLDLSKAGELGITDAYDAIKKYCQ